ncbi:winged helix-turn-helix transcriptional regulator [Brevibacillus choshinensis]|uniref:Winged helix-turn-helix transcriptional regulator n=2 Tax=Brevibacillus choshinensis TaxID=54911 RepID=A0ABX7FS27_BRECH|nr:winged helix-turn-helix transcriptional regulator [Brevibacillus choshinensis]
MEYIWFMNKTLHALSEPNRMRIVELLRDGPLSVGDIAKRLRLQQPQASKHVKVLAEAGIAEVQVQANRRIYQLRPEPFRELENWVITYRHIWEEKFDRLEEYLQKLQGKQ